VNYRSVVFCLVVALSASIARAQRGQNSEQMCRSVRSLLQASSSDFNPIKRNITRHSDGATDWEPSISIGGSKDCEGQSDPELSSSMSCTMVESQSADDVATAYRDTVSAIRSCLDSNYVYSEKQGGKPSRRSTPIKEATFEVKGKGGSPDGPAVRISMSQFHRTSRSGYELTIWVDAKDKE
jgi:hypothetical protein